MCILDNFYWSWLCDWHLTTLYFPEAPLGRRIDSFRKHIYIYIYIQYIPGYMHTVFALLCFVVVIHWLIFPYPSGLLHWHCGNLTIAPVPAKQPWWIWINTSCEFIMNDCITTTKQSTTKPCAYILGYTVYIYIYIYMSSVITLGQFWPSGIFIACVCGYECPCVCVNRELVRTITHRSIKLGSPNLNQRCITPWFRSLLFFEMIDLELLGQI